MRQTQSNVVRLAAMTVALLWPMTAPALSLPGAARAAQDGEARTLKIKEAGLLKDVLRVEEISNLQAADFPKGLALKVRNVSDKEIFGIFIVAILEQTGSLYFGRPLGFDFNYGEPRLVDLNEHRAPDAVSLRPGEAHLFSLDDKQAMAIRNQITVLSNDHPELFLQKIFCTVQTINFGDGTGYIIGHPEARRQ